MTKISKLDVLRIFILSGSSGQRAVDATHTILEQYPTQRVSLTLFLQVGKRIGNEREAVAVKRGIRESEDALQRAKREKAIVVHTFVVKRLAKYTNLRAKKLGVRCIDYFGATMAAISEATGLAPLEKPGHVHDPRSAARGEALRFALAHEDGLGPEGLTHADLVLVGVSRAGKTAVTMVLVPYCLKVANVPFVSLDTFPKQILDVPKDRVFFLDANIDHVIAHRSERLKHDVGHVDPKADYINPEMVEGEITELRRMANRQGWTKIQASGKAIEEIATDVLKKYQNRFPLPA